MKIKAVLTIVSVFVIAHLPAQMPLLRSGGNQNTQDVFLESLDVKVDITGTIATTRFTMTFKNRTGKILEGELLFPMPAGVTVSHYVLDINGKMREAVPVEKAKATQVFEEIEQRRVDPGLLERVEGNNFRTRIYPIPANGTRTISIGYEQELPIEKGRLIYRLPMDYKESIPRFSLKATVLQSRQKPQMDEKLDNELIFDKLGSNYVADYSRRDYKPLRSLAFSLPAANEIPQVWMQSAAGSHYFLASCAIEAPQQKKIWSDNIGLIWDTSLSGLQRDIPRELELLDAIIRDKKNLTIQLYLLNNTFTKAQSFQIKDGNWAELRTTLQQCDYDGGTNYETMNLKYLLQREFLLFSDGMSTLGESDSFLSGSLGRPIHCITSSSKSDYSALKWITMQSGGKLINLNAVSHQEAITELMNESLQFIGIRKSDNVSEVYPSKLASVQNNFSIAGILEGNSAEITLLFGYGNRISVEKKVMLNSENAVSQGNIYKMWAQKKISELDMQYEKNKTELTELGQQFGIVTRNTSLIVLETLQDYITYQITPPAELLAEYNQWKQNQLTIRMQQRRDMLAAAKESAETLKQWWNTDFLVTKPRYPQPDDLDHIEVSEAAVVESVELNDRIAEVAEDEVAMDMMIVPESQAEYARADRDRADVSDNKSALRFTSPIAKKEEAVKNVKSKELQPVIKRVEIKQDNDYMKKLTGDIDADYRTYLDIRSVYIGTPAFYFDMADWFFQHKDQAKALRILTSIADMELENASLFRLLGYRLKEYGEYSLEAYVCSKVIRWRPMEPQSYRDYALALADAGKNQIALDSLYSLLTQPYSNAISWRSAGIEEVVVTEMNRLITNHRLKTREIEKELIQSMPVDVRVVINWNKNSTDIDLHVTDPSGEKCFYSHPQTAMGGRISRDITQGYGPEQFMLKKAQRGTYQVFVNYFGDSQVKAEGPSTVMVEVFTNYATSREQRQVICLQMSKELKQKDGLVKVAEFEFK